MSKYEPLWQWISVHAGEKSMLTFSQIAQILGQPIDHAFLTFKKELTVYGYEVGKISMKNQTVTFIRREIEPDTQKEG